VLVQPDPEALARFAAATAGLVIRETLTRRAGAALVGLPGGETPRRFLELLAEEPGVDWGRVVVLPADERAVPPGDPRSNEGMIRSCLLERIAGVGPRLLSWEAGSGLGAAELCANFQRRFLSLDPAGTPVMDLCVLGMGQDGHTASLFPGREYDPRPLALASTSPTGEPRLSLGPAAIRAAGRLALLLAGPEKSETLVRVVEGPYDPVSLPAQLAARRPQGGEVWCDAAAAARLKGG
jgi:6-phosphogluconolactonase